MPLLSPVTAVEFTPVLSPRAGADAAANTVTLSPPPSPRAPSPLSARALTPSLILGATPEPPVPVQLFRKLRCGLQVEIPLTQEQQEEFRTRNEQLTDALRPLFFTIQSVQIASTLCNTVSIQYLDDSGLSVTQEYALDTLLEYCTLPDDQQNLESAIHNLQQFVHTIYDGKYVTQYTYEPRRRSRQESLAPTLNTPRSSMYPLLRDLSSSADAAGQRAIALYESKKQAQDPSFQPDQAVRAQVMDRMAMAHHIIEGTRISIHEKIGHLQSQQTTPPDPATTQALSELERLDQTFMEFDYFAFGLACMVITGESPQDGTQLTACAQLLEEIVEKECQERRRAASQQRFLSRIRSDAPSDPHYAKSVAALVFSTQHSAFSRLPYLSFCDDHQIGESLEDDLLRALFQGENEWTLRTQFPPSACVHTAGGPPSIADGCLQRIQDDLGAFLPRVQPLGAMPQPLVAALIPQLDSSWLSPLAPMPLPQPPLAPLTPPVRSIGDRVADAVESAWDALRGLGG